MNKQNEIDQRDHLEGLPQRIIDVLNYALCSNILRRHSTPQQTALKA